MYRLVALAAALAAVLSACSSEDGSRLSQRFPSQAERILGGPGYVAEQGVLLAARVSDPSAIVDPVKAAEAALARRGGLDVRLPLDGAGAAVFTVGNLRIEVRERGLSGPASLIRGAVAYSRPGTTSWWTVAADGHEEWLEVDAAGDGPVARWDVAGATLRQAEDAVELLDDAGTARARVTAPHAYAQGGAEKRAWLRVEGGALALYTDARGAALVDPLWTTLTSMTLQRSDHTATLLSTGKVLVTGGPESQPHERTELYDPATGYWSVTGSLATPRRQPTATLLASGKVLVVGGDSGYAGCVASAELYDPATGVWSATGSLAAKRCMHTATLLPTGKVLVAGGWNGTGSMAAAAELYDPSTGTWSDTGSLVDTRCWHTATLLPTGKVLIAGGSRSGYYNPAATPHASVELYDPAEGTWTATGPLATAREGHSATLLNSGKVLVAGGATSSTTLTATAELYDPEAGAWSGTGSLPTTHTKHTATLLPSGKVLVVGMTSAELFDPLAGTWAAAGAPATPRSRHTATLLPSGQVLVAGGASPGYTASVERFDPATGAWSATAPLATARAQHTATLLASGKVLVAGGWNGAAALNGAELYDPASGTWNTTGSLTGARRRHTATLLPSGKVLVAGGLNGARLATAELYDPDAGTWTPTGALTTARDAHTATLLPSGKVLVAGGWAGALPFATAELYDPADGAWRPTASLAQARMNHSATLLQSGKVLVAGGVGSTGLYVGPAELYDPPHGSWTTTGSMLAAREAHTATLLPSGWVLVAGGIIGGTRYRATEFYNPETGNWSSAGTIGTGRFGHTATLLPSGSVLVTGGSVATDSYTASAELYDQASRSWTPAPSMTAARENHTATLLPTGEVLVAGGRSATSLADAERYDEGRGALPAWTPTVATSPASVAAGTSLTLGGTLFTGLSEASTGGGSSATSYPLVQLMGSDRSAFAPVSAFSPATATATLPKALPAGWYWLRVVANGVTSAAVPLLVEPPPAPVAEGQAAATNEDSPTPVTLVASDADGDPLTFAVATPPAHGTLSGTGANLTYTPAPDFHGSDGFTFVANDGYVDSAPASVTISVAPVNDAPVALAQAVTPAEDTPLAVTLAGADADGDTLTYSVVTPPAHGVLSGSGADLTYTPAADYHGPDGFSFQVRDGSVSSGAATVSIDVAAVNDAPSATPQAATGTEDLSLDLTLEGLDVEGDPLTFTVATMPLHGTLSGSGANLTYVPDADFTGSDAFTFVANDGLLDSSPVAVSIDVAPVNDAPVAAPQSAVTAEGTAVGVTLSATDVDEDPLTYTVVTPPAHGALTGSGASLTYTPDPDFAGADAFTFVANDGAADSAPATVTLTVTPADEPAGGCSCGTTGEVAPLGALLVGMLGLGRRRRPEARRSA